MIQVVGLGAGGHAKVVIEILQLRGGYDIVGLLDPKRELWGTEMHGVLVLGDDNLLPKLIDQGVRNGFIGVGAVGDTRPRSLLYHKARQCGLRIVRAVHPQAIIAPSVEIGQGPTIMASAVINAAAKLGNDVVVNTGAIVEHDCILEDHVHIATGARLASTVHVGEGAHIGVGASVRQSICIGRRAIVGAGAVVIDDVSDAVVVVGVPAEVLREVHE